MATNHSEPPARHPDAGPTLGDVIELVWLPALGALATAAITWLIWYYTNAACTAEQAQSMCCNPAPIARYIDVEIFGRMLTYGAIVAGGLGFWRYDVIKRERAARIAAENRAIAIQQQADADRRQVESERQAERQAFLDTLTAERQQFMATINELVAQQRNGNHGGNGHSPTE